MFHRTLMLIGLLSLGCGPSAPADAGPLDGGADAGRVYSPAAFTPTESTRAYCQADDDAVEARITGLLAELTQREKLSLMSGTAVAIIDHTWQVNGVDRLGIGGLHMLDGPRGLSSFSGLEGTAFPVAMMRGATFSPELERRVGEAMALEVRSVGADVLLAPTINILRHPRWGRAQETYSEDVHHLGEMGVAFIQGAQSQGVLASAKHFAANSIEDTRNDVDVQVDERTLREIYLPHFRRAVQEAQVASVMSAYNQVNGDYCDLSSHLLTDILKEEWGFAGFVESDWILGTHGDVASVRAGLDIEMPSDAHFRALGRALAEGNIEEAEIDASVRRILRAQLCFGLDTRVYETDDASARQTPAHLALAREVATRGIVLLENRIPDGAPADSPLVLPLDAARLSEIVVVGRAADAENIGDEGSSSVTPSDVVTALEGLRAGLDGAVTVTHIAGESLTAADELAVQRADAVIVVTGLLAEDEGESDIGAGDRDTLELMPASIALIRAVSALNPAVVVVLEGGSAIIVESWVDEVQALLMAFYPGSQGGHAIHDVLFGVEPPSGRMPFSVPRLESDLPVFDNVSTTVTYGYFHGYRHLEREGASPRYPFGYGLGYTDVAYEAVRLSASSVPTDGTLLVEVDVRNVGLVRGRETVQVYVSADGSSVERSPRDLRAFAQLELEPGETSTAVLVLEATDLAFWNVERAAWEVEPIDYVLTIGSNSADPRLSTRFTIE